MLFRSQQAELARHVTQRSLLHIDELVGSDATLGDGQTVLLEAGSAQHGVDHLDQQALLVHPPVATGVAGHSGHRVGCGQLTGQLGGLPSFHTVDADPALLATGYQKITLLDVRYLSSYSLPSLIDFKNQDVLFLYSTSVLNHSETLK